MCRWALMLAWLTGAPVAHPPRAPSQAVTVNRVPRIPARDELAEAWDAEHTPNVSINDIPHHDE
jgi:hypothetical protein